MRLLLRRAFAAALAAASLAGGLSLIAGPAAAQDGYYRRYFDDEPRPERVYRERRYQQRRVYEDDRDRYLDERMRYYQRDAVARREAEARRRAFEAEQQRRRAVRIPFLQRLFGSREPEDDEPAAWGGGRADPGAVEVRPKTKRARRKPPPVEAAPGAPGQPSADVAQQPQPTVPPTTFVAVFGDSIADGLAAGLAEGFSDAPELAVKRYVKPNAGLVRADYHDFVEAARKALETDPITYAVIDVGVNDRQPFLDMRDATPLSDRWKQRYAARIDAMLAPFKEKKIPVYWVGLAPSASARASSDHTALNVLARDRVEAAGGTYVDVWEGFVDEKGDYAATGPQLDGQTTRLRLDDGVHFSKAGARKLAHYVEREIRKVFTPKAPEPLTAGVPAGELPVDPTVSPLIDRPKPIAGPLVVLSAPRATQGGALLGAAPPPPPTPEATLVRGEAPAPAPGRMDDHRWPGSGPAKPQAAAGEPPKP